MASPPISISVFFSSATNVFLGYGLITNIPTNRLTEAGEDGWLTVYQNVSSAPLNAAKATVAIVKLAQAVSSDVFVDDIELLIRRVKQVLRFPLVQQERQATLEQ